MWTEMDAVTRRLFEGACAALDDGTDNVAVMERALDLVCLLLRRADDRPARDRVMASLSERLADLEEQEGQGPGLRGAALRDTFRDAIRQAASERAATARRQPLSAKPGGRRTADAARAGAPVDTASPAR